MEGIQGGCKIGNEKGNSIDYLQELWRRRWRKSEEEREGGR